MAVLTTLHIGRPCMRCTPTASAGRGGQACRRATGWVRWREGGGGRALPAGGGGRLGRRRGRGGGGCGGLGRAPCSAARWGGQGPHPVPPALGGGMPATCAHACAGWRDWAATPAHFSLGGGGGGRRRWWASRLCGLPPPRYHRGAKGVL